MNKTSEFISHLKCKIIVTKFFNEEFNRIEEHIELSSTELFKETKLAIITITGKADIWKNAV